jgi:hypothetical protein
MAYQSILLAFVVATLLGQDATVSVALKRFEVIRVSAADIQRVPNDLRLIFADPVPDAEVVNSLNDATMRAGFTARLPKSDKPPQFGVVAPVSEQIKIDVAGLRSALHDANADDVVVPDSWDGVTIDIKQRSGVFADFGGFFFVQAPPLTLTVRSGFPLDQFTEVLCRVLQIPAAQAREIRERYGATPINFFPISRKYDMDIHEVKLRSGAGLLMQNGSKQGELALAWSDADRTYFLSGQLTETQAIATADSIQ